MNSTLQFCGIAYRAPVSSAQAGRSNLLLPHAIRKENLLPRPGGCATFRAQGECCWARMLFGEPILEPRPTNARQEPWVCRQPHREAIPCLKSKELRMNSRVAAEPLSSSRS